MNQKQNGTSELLVDRTTVRNPYLRLLLTAIGQEVATGSPWVAVNERIAMLYGLRQPLLSAIQQPARLSA